MIWKKILAIGAHCDDIEYGCAGFLSKITNGDHDFDKIIVVNLTKPADVGDKSAFVEGEWATAADEWGFRFADHRFEHYNEDFTVRCFKELRQGVLDYMCDLRNYFEPDVVLVPSSKEIHQDHQVVTEEALRAFQRVSMLGYEMPLISLSTENMLYVPLTEEEFQAKCRSIAAYKSQHWRASANMEAAVALGKLRGNQCGHQFAEAFEVIRMIL